MDDDQHCTWKERFGGVGELWLQYNLYFSTGLPSWANTNTPIELITWQDICDRADYRQARTGVGEVPRPITLPIIYRPSNLITGNTLKARILPKAGVGICKLGL